MKNKLLPFALLLSALLPVCCYSQCDGGKTVILDDSNKTTALVAYHCDTVYVTCDTAYMLSKYMYRTFKSAYNSFRNKTSPYNEMIAEYESLVAFQQEELTKKERYYQELKTNFDNLSSQTKTFLDRTENNTNAIQTSLNTAATHMDSIKSLVGDSMDKLKLHNRERLKLAVGGFTIGVATAALVFILVK